MLTTCRANEGGSPLCALGHLNQCVEFRGRCLGSIEKSRKNQSWMVKDEATKSYDLFVIASHPTKYNNFTGMTGEDRTTEKVIEFCKRAGIPTDKVWYTYMARCAPPKSRAPSVKEINACLNHLYVELNRIKPRLVLLLGNAPLRVFKLNKEGGVNATHGQVFQRTLPDLNGASYTDEFNVMCTFDPNILFHKPDPKLENRIIDDYRKAKRVMRDGPVAETGAYQSDFRLIKTLGDLDEMIEQIRDKKFFAFDTESRGFPWTTQPMICMSFCWGYENDLIETAVLPIYKSKIQSIDHLKSYVKAHEYNKDLIHLDAYWKVDLNEELLGTDWEKLILLMNNHGPQAVYNKLRPLFEDETVAKSAHNIKYDINVLRQHAKIEVKGFLYDSMLMHHDLNEYGPHGLEYLADVEFGVGDYSAELKQIVGKGKALKHTYDHIPDDIMWKYAATDAECCFRLTKRYYNELKAKPHLWQLYCEDYEKTTKTLADAEWRGHAVNLTTAHKILNQFTDKQDMISKKIEEATWPGFKPSSPSDVAKALTQMGYAQRIADKTKASGVNTSKEILAELQKELPLAGYILQYRNTVKMLGTYVNNLLDDVDSDGRIRYSWLIHGTESGRLSCRFFHQIPRRDSNLKYNMRDMFVAGAGRKLVYFDYSQIELRVFAILANEVEMLKCLYPEMYGIPKDQAVDIHAKTAEQILGFDITEHEDTYKANRQVGKDTNFGIIYGSKGYQLMQKTLWIDKNGNKWPLDQAMLSKGMERFRSTYPQADIYLKSIPDIARKNGNLYTTPFGREIRIGPNLTHYDKPIREHAERKLVNATVQSPAGDITKRTLNLMADYINHYVLGGDLQPNDVYLVNTVHDSGVYDCKEELVPWFCKTLAEVAGRKIPEIQNYSFPSNIGVGDTWSEAEDDADK